MVKLCFSIPKIKSKTSINKTRETYLQDQRLTRIMCWKSRKELMIKYKCKCQKAIIEQYKLYCAKKEVANYF